MRLVLVALFGLVLAAPAAATLREPTPSATQFGRDFVSTANAYAASHGQARRLKHPDCVQAVPGKYMCSYAVWWPDGRAECHLMQAKWMPLGPSTYKITLAGRVPKCSSLRAALDSIYA